MRIVAMDHPFGAEVSGLNPAVPIDDAIIARLRSAFDDRSMLIFRNLACDFDFQDYLSQMMVGNALNARGDDPAETFISNREEGSAARLGRLMFHSDLMNSEDSYQVLSLYGTEVEQPAAPTLFVSTVNGWETLSDDLRTLVANRYAIHGHDAYGKRGGSEDLSTARPDNSGHVSLPIAHRHPRTGRTMLYVSQLMTAAIDGLPEDESEALLERLFDHLYAEPRVFVHRWREGDLVLWDNLSLQHARSNVSADGPARTLRKTYARPRRIVHPPIGA